MRTFISSRGQPVATVIKTAALVSCGQRIGRLGDCAKRLLTVKRVESTAAGLAITVHGGKRWHLTHAENVYCAA